MTKLQALGHGKPLNRIVAVAAYEDSSTDARVNEFCRSLAKHAGPNCEVHKQMWLVSELRNPRLRAIAAGEACHADLIIISVQHADSLPPEVQSWIDAWLAQKGRRSILLSALFDPIYQGVSSSMQAYLKEVAERGKMEFLAETEEVPEEH